MPKATRASAITAAASSSTSRKNLAIDRACKLFSCGFANVQPNSGSQAKQGVFQALLQPGDTILGMSLDAGGHLPMARPPTSRGKWFKAVQYGVRKQDLRLDYDQVQALATEHKPKMIIAGGSAIPRVIDFARMREIADSVGAFLLVDMRISPVWWPRASIPRPSRTPMSPPPPRTRRCAVRVGGMILTT